MRRFHDSGEWLHLHHVCRNNWTVTYKYVIYNLHIITVQIWDLSPFFNICTILLYSITIITTSLAICLIKETIHGRNFLKGGSIVTLLHLKSTDLIQWWLVLLILMIYIINIGICPMCRFRMKECVFSTSSHSTESNMTKYV